MIGVRCAVVCPSASSISPCTCGSTSIDPNGLYLNCFYLGLSDSQMSSILDVLLNSNGTSPLVELTGSYNNLKEIPSQISKFNSIQKIDLSSNQITSIPSNAFSFPSTTSVEIFFQSNQITSIPSGAFSFPKSTSVDIYLTDNQITSIPSGAFSFPSATSVYIDLYSNQITSIPSDVLNFPNATEVDIRLKYNQITSIAPNTFSQGDNNKFNSLFQFARFYSEITFINFISFLQAIFHSSNWPKTI